MSLVLAAILAAVPVTSVSADKVSDLEQQKSSQQSKLNAARNKADSLEGQEESVTEAMEAVNARLVENLAAIAMQQATLDQLDQQIAETQEQYDAAKADEEKQYIAMKERVKYMYEQGDMTYMQILLTASSFSDMVNKTAYVSKLYEYDRRMLEEYKAIRQKVADTQAELEAEQDEQEAALVEMEEERTSMNEEMAELKAEYGDIQDAVAQAQAAAAELATKLSETSAALTEAKDEKEREEAARRQAELLAEAARKAAEEAAAAAATIIPKEAVKEETTETTEEVQEEEEEEESTPKASNVLVANSNGVTGQDVVNYASQFIGNPYVYGGSSLTNGTDCSGFTMAVYNHFGYSLPHQDVGQRSKGIAVDSIENALPGDLICYPGHVAIYCGNGTIVHASTPATGIKYSNYNYRAYVAIRRIIY